MKNLFFACLWLLCLGEGYAQTADTLRTVTLSPLTVIGLRLDTDTLNMDVQPPDRLGHDPGAFLGQHPMISGIRKSGSYGFDPVMRGFKYDQLNIVIDGMACAVAACPNRMDPPASQIPLNQMERVEIYAGPHSLRYGPAFGGTINFVSQSPRFTAQPSTSGRLAAGYEGNGRLYRTEAAIGWHTQKLNAQIFGTWSEGQDYRAGNDTDVAASFARGSFGAQLDGQLTKEQQLSLSLTRNIGRDVDFPALPMDLRSDDAWIVHAKHQLDFTTGKFQSLQTQAFFTKVDHVMNNLLRDLNPRMMDAETVAETAAYGGRSELTLRTGKGGRAFVGLDMRGEEAKGLRTRAFLMGPMAGRILEDNPWQHGRILRTGIFGEFLQRGGALEWTASLRMDYVSAESLDPTDEFGRATDQTSSQDFNPSLSLGMQQQLSSVLSWGVWLGRSQRSAGLTERFMNYFPVGLDPYELVGDPTLKPEANHQLDLRLTLETKRSSLQITGFASYLTNFITSEIRPDLQPRIMASPGVRQFVNRDKAYLIGTEVKWQHSWNDHLGHSLQAAYTYGQDAVLDAPLPEIAPLDVQLKLWGSFWDHRLMPELVLRRVLAQERVSEVFGERVTPDFTTLDLILRAKPIKNLEISTGIYNVLDQAYYEHLNRAVRADGQPPLWSPGRNAFLRVVWQW